MSHVLYRKYRPQKLSDVHGQEHVKKIIANALKEKKLAHAYLFSGPRGIGKTTVARILAQELGVSGVDLIEIDAASHRGIDSVRELRDTIHFRPSQSENKLYILDEAHMLTNEAFNALLKTLEEPPTYVYFVLCTTEPHKLPLTIVSRCQQLSFIPASGEELKEYLQKILKLEAYEIDLEALKLIVEYAHGSYRDSLVLLEQSIRHTDGSRINPITLSRVLGSPLPQKSRELLELIVRKNINALARELNSLAEEGLNIQVLTDNLIQQLTRTLLLDEEDSVLRDQVGFDDRISLLEGLMFARQNMLYNKVPEVPLLVELLKWCKTSEGNQTLTNTKAKLNDKEILAPQVFQEGQNQAKNNLDSLWEQVMTNIKQEKNGIEVLLQACHYVEVNQQDELLLGVSYAFHKKKIEEGVNRQIIEKVVKQLLGRPVRVKCFLQANQSLPKNKKSHSRDQSEVVMQIPESKSKNRDLIDLAREVFGGQLID